MGRFGLDAGTYNLVCCVRNEAGEFAYRREVNAFLELPLNNRFVFNMMKAAGVPLIERDNVAYALGEKAVEMAYTMSSLDLKRPMSDGCVNPKERDAFNILSIMIHSLLGEVKTNKEIVYYSVPANAINEQTDADYHNKILKSIFNAYKSKQGNTVAAYPINEALAITYAEAAEKGYTAISCSFGAGMCNVCYSIFGAPVFSFSIVNSGDWIDKMAAKATGESPTFINKEKTKVDLSKKPSTLIERAIQTQYGIMIENAVQGIKKGLSEAGNKARSDNPIDIIIAGGTSSPAGFDALFSDVVAQSDLPIKVGNIIRPSDPLYCVSRGCTIAAENHSSK